jgi:hypothetical protein
MGVYFFQTTSAKTNKRVGASPSDRPKYYDKPKVDTWVCRYDYDWSISE